MKAKYGWGNLTPRELRNYRIIGLFITLMGYLVLTYINEIFGKIMLFIGAGGFMGSFFIGSGLKSIIYAMRLIEPAYLDWSDEKMEVQIKAIKKCGYRWHETKNEMGWQHSKTKLSLRIEGLNAYTPDRIIETYEKIWSKQDLKEVKNRDEFSVKLQNAIMEGKSDEEIEQIIKNYQKENGII